ncbi:MAG TPA: hypothetical protein PLM71_12025, partial [Syntrophorhabdaceae bacterium]|nr:hypothetical protein [Syntrophorhabdaceae bacterium]
MSLLRFIVSILFVTLSFVPAFSNELIVFAGAASKPPAEEAANLFEKKTGIKVNLTFGGSGFVLSQMSLAKKG